MTDRCGPTSTEPFPMPEIDENGVDRSQIRRLLALTPAERLAQNDAYMNAMLTIAAKNDRERRR